MPNRADHPAPPPLPAPRGPFSERLLDALRRRPGDGAVGLCSAVPEGDPLADEDLHLALYVCYELHYRSFEGVDDGWEWEPALLELRRRLEEPFERALRVAVPAEEPGPFDVAARLREVVDDDPWPSLSKHLERKATLEQFREFVIARSAYHLKEADPHSWAIPRLAGAPKAALVEVQTDEYGGGNPRRMHSELFAGTMRALGLDDRYGAYIDVVPGFVLATVNLMSLFGLHRRWRGAIAGHLAVFEMTSPLPNRRYGNGLRRLGFGSDATVFYDEHVEADAVHSEIAAHDLAGALGRQEPQLAADVLFGARALLLLDGLAATRMLEAWGEGRSALRDPSSPALVA